MFNIGFTEMLILVVLAIVFIGPKQLPEVARALGRMLNELKRSTDAVRDDFKTVAFDATQEVRKTREEIRKATLSAIEEKPEQPTSQAESDSHKPQGNS